MKKLSLLFISFTFATYSTIEVKNHLGEYTEVYGKVYGVYYHLKGYLFINLDDRYPHQKMTVFIWSEYVDNFDFITSKTNVSVPKAAYASTKANRRFFSNHDRS